MGVRVGWPGVLAAALIGAILGALLTWATLTGGSVVLGAAIGPPPRTATMLVTRPARPISHASAPTETHVSVGRVASPLQLAATYDFDVDLDYAAGTAVVAERVRITNLGSRVDTVQLFVLPDLDADGAREFELRKFEVDGRRPALRWTQEAATWLFSCRPRSATARRPTSRSTSRSTPAQTSPRCRQRPCRRPTA